MAEQPRPKSPPGYLDLYAKRRQQAKLHLLEREIGLLQFHSFKTIPAEMPKSIPEGEKQRQLDREIRQMISTLTSRLTDVHQLNKPGSSDPLRDEEERGLRVITLAGTNTGATMRGEVLGRHRKLDEQGESLDDEPEGIGETYVNSNCQAVNNSIMLGSKYTSKDPGVHMDITDVVEPLNTAPGKSGGSRLRKGKGLAQASNNPDSEFTE